MDSRRKPTPIEMRIPSHSKEIPGYDGFYRADIFGNIWSCRKICPGLNRKGEWRKMGLEVRNQDGYIIVALTMNGKVKEARVHSLVLTTFRGPRPRGLMSRHLDSDRRNNRLDNLCWGTNSENQVDRRGTITDERGENNPSAKLTWAQVNEIRDTFYQFSKRFGVCPATIEDVILGRTWKVDIQKDS